MWGVRLRKNIDRKLFPGREVLYHSAAMPVIADSVTALYEAALKLMLSV